MADWDREIGAMTLFGSYVSFQFLVTQYLQSLAGWSALSTALAFLPAGVVVAILSTRMSAIIGRLGPARVTVLAFIAGYYRGTTDTLIRGIAAGFGFSIDDACRRRLPRIGVAALAMGGLLWATTRLVLAPNADLHGLALAAALLVLIAGGMALYGLLLTLFGVTGWRAALDAIRRTAPGDLRA